MSLIRWFGEDNVFSKLSQMQQELDNALSTYRSPVSSGMGVFPPINIYDDNESYIVRAELPGVDPKNIDITATGNTLHIKGKREPEKLEKEDSYHRRERQFGEFSRAFTLPEAIDSGKVLASSKNGILEIHLPRAEQAKAKKIQVKAN